VKGAPRSLMDVGPLSIVSAKDEQGRDRAGLYLILVKDHQAKIGPYFADFSKATDAARKIVKEFPTAVWKQPIGWLARQKELLGWIEKEIGYQEDLIGGHWVDENGKIILNTRR
jgi:hypothetical protein